MAARMDSNSNVYIPRADFEAFVELVGGDVYGPDYNRANISVWFKMGEIEVELTGMTILHTPAGSWFGRFEHDGEDGQGWNEVRLSYWWGQNFHSHGKGCRSSEHWAALIELTSLLTGRDENGKVL